MSTSPLTRRSFLARALGAAAAAPLVAAATMQASPATSAISRDDIAANLPPGSFVMRDHAIKVPSNRSLGVYRDRALNWLPCHSYEGDWDGTFKLERGCTNPAYILADLYERTGETPDWVAARHIAGFPTKHLNWQMLYDWGQACDERFYVWKEVTKPDGASTRHVMSVDERPRLTVNVMCRTHEEMVQLRETLRMHCLQWQSTDPRYRTSYPGKRKAA